MMPLNSSCLSVALAVLLVPLKTTLVRNGKLSISNITAILTQEDANPFECTFDAEDGVEPCALTFLVHFVGDCHQPLHVNILYDMMIYFSRSPMHLTVEEMMFKLISLVNLPTYMKSGTLKSLNVGT